MGLKTEATVFVGSRVFKKPELADHSLPVYYRDLKRSSMPVESVRQQTE